MLTERLVPTALKDRQTDLPCILRALRPHTGPSRFSTRRERLILDRDIGKFKTVENMWDSFYPPKSHPKRVKRGRMEVCTGYQSITQMKSQAGSNHTFNIYSYT